MNEKITEEELAFVKKLYEESFQIMPERYGLSTDELGCFYKAAMTHAFRWEAIAAAYAYGFKRGRRYQKKASKAKEATRSNV